MLILYVSLLIYLVYLGSGGLAFFGGLAFALFVGNPKREATLKYSGILLPISVMGLGAGIDFKVILEAGSHGFSLTLFSVLLTLSIGHIIGKLFRLEWMQISLVSVGTAICGGSAIATLSPIIRAKNEDISVSLTMVFILNSIALILFPIIGRKIGLSENDFGLWSAMAIHDTSSVIGSTLNYGQQALEIGSIVKLSRSLWIFPISVGYFYYLECTYGKNFQRRKYNLSRTWSLQRLPWFIFGFLILSLVSSYLTSMSGFSSGVFSISKIGIVLSLFLIGSNLEWKNFKIDHLKLFFFSALLWLLVAVISLLSIKFFGFRI